MMRRGTQKEARDKLPTLGESDSLVGQFVAGFLLLGFPPLFEHPCDHTQ